MGPGARSCPVLTYRKATGHPPLISRLACVPRSQSMGSVSHLNLQAACSTLSTLTHPFCPSVGSSIVLSLWTAAEPLSTAHTRDNGPLGAGMIPAPELGSQTGTGRELQLRLQKLLDLKPPKPSHERAGRAGGSLPTTYDLSVIPKYPTQPPAWLKEAL